MSYLDILIGLFDREKWRRLFRECPVVFAAALVLGVTIGLPLGFYIAVSMIYGMCNG